MSGNLDWCLFNGHTYGAIYHTFTYRQTHLAELSVLHLQPCFAYIGTLEDMPITRKRKGKRGIQTQNNQCSIIIYRTNSFYGRFESWNLFYNYGAIFLPTSCIDTIRRLMLFFNYGVHFPPTSYVDSELWLVCIPIIYTNPFKIYLLYFFVMVSYFCHLHLHYIRFFQTNTVNHLRAQV